MCVVAALQYRCVCVFALVSVVLDTFIGILLLKTHITALDCFILLFCYTEFHCVFANSFWFYCSHTLCLLDYSSQRLSIMPVSEYVYLSTYSPCIQIFDSGVWITIIFLLLTYFVFTVTRPFSFIQHFPALFLYLFNQHRIFVAWFRSIAMWLYIFLFPTIEKGIPWFSGQKALHK